MVTTLFDKSILLIRVVYGLVCSLSKSNVNQVHTCYIMSRNRNIKIIPLKSGKSLNHYFKSLRTVFLFCLITDTLHRVTLRNIKLRYIIAAQSDVIEPLLNVCVCCNMAHINTLPRDTCHNRVVMVTLTLAVTCYSYWVSLWLHSHSLSCVIVTECCHCYTHTRCHVL